MPSDRTAGPARREPAPTPASDPPPPPDRWRFLRDVGVFQLKLVIDGLRDALLVPISLGAALLDLVTRPDRPGSSFYRVLATGRRSERWIDLFEAVRRGEAGDGERRRDPGASVDEVFDRLEDLLVEQHAKGGVTASAKQTIDRALDSLAARRSRRE